MRRPKRPKLESIVSDAHTHALADPNSPELPDTDLWRPRSDASDLLSSAFASRCRMVEADIFRRSANEREMNIDNFDSGAGVEDIVRSALREILPKRYAVLPGVVNDREGKTGGDVDIAIFNEQWFPVVKSGAEFGSRRVHIPIDGVYAVVEVKQTLNYDSFDSGMRKLVSCHRLERPRTFANRLVENRDLCSCFHGLTNPLYSVLLATSMDPQIPFEWIANRFYDINRTLDRLHVVRCLCVLGVGTITWGWWDENGNGRSALFMRDDLFHPVFPVYFNASEEQPALYSFIADLLAHLYNSVLRAEDLAYAYGTSTLDAKRPASRSVRLDPDDEWLESLNHEYVGRGIIGNRPTQGGIKPSEIHEAMVEEIYSRLVELEVLQNESMEPEAQ
jgi:hypothetical protein